LRDRVFSSLHSHFSEKQTGEASLSDRLQFLRFERWFILEKEAPLRYSIGTGATLSHKSDLLLSVMNNKMGLTPVMNVEIEFRSCVSDAFKARAYDQIHLKKAYPHLLGLLVFIRPNRGGISSELAKLIGYPFDLFLTAKEKDLPKGEMWGTLSEIFEDRMRGVAADPTIGTPYIRAEIVGRPSDSA
jgi:hypothetical protein